MTEQPFAEINARDSYTFAQANPAPESKWLNELDGTSQASKVWKTGDTPKSGATTGDAANDATKPGAMKSDGDSSKPPIDAGSQKAASGSAKTPDKMNYEENRFGSGVLAPTMVGGVSAAGFSRPAIDVANKLAFNLKGLKGSSQLLLTAKDAANAWITDATATKLLVSRADAMKGITTPTLPSMSQNLKRGALNTLGVGAILEADRAFFREPEDRSWNLSSLTVPIGMAIGRGAGQKLLFSGLGLLSGHALDRIAPPPMPNKSALSTFTTYDALTMGVAFAIPAKSPAVKAGLVGIAWAAGNGMETISGVFQRLKDVER